MTGESLPLEKFVEVALKGAEPFAGATALEQRNLVFMGTNVVSGTATAVVVATGGRGYFGTLAKGAVLRSRKKVVVKRLDAIQNFGAMDILCTDKTGTLTQDKIALAGYFKLQALPAAYFGWLVGILLGYCTLTTLMKRLYIRRFG